MVATLDIGRIAITEKVAEIVNGSGWPDLAISILNESINTPSNLDVLDFKFDVDRQEVDAVVGYLVQNGLLSRKNEGQGPYCSDTLWADDNVKPYFQSNEPYGDGILLAHEGLNEDTVKRVMNGLQEKVEFCFRKDYTFSIGKLDGIREQIHSALEDLKQKELGLLRASFKVPQEYTGFPSFLDKADPTTSSDGYNVKIQKFTFGGKFPTIDDAFVAGFDEGRGYLITRKGKENENRNLHPSLNVDRRDDVYDLKLMNTRYSTIEHSMAHQKEVQSGLEKLKDQIERSLDGVIGG